jgi:hypothetical protein
MDDHCGDENHFPQFSPGVDRIKIPLPAGVEDTQELRERIAREV